MTEFQNQVGETLLLIIVFLIFVWVLKKFAWGPILSTLDERQKKIQQGFEDIESLQADAAATHEQYEDKLREIEDEARARIQESVAEGRRIAGEITQKAQNDAGDLIEKARSSVELQIAAAHKQLREDLISLTMQATEKIIHERMNETKDRKLVGDFIEQIEKESA